MKTKAKKNVLAQHKYPLIEFNKIVSYIQKLLSKKYFISKTSYQKTLIKNIIYDDKRRLVSVFKEQLIINDTSEYLKRYYKKKESFVRLNKYFKLYEEYSKLFPNYTPLIEAKYIYTNIHKKQKIIDLQQNNSKEKIRKKFRKRNKIKNDKIFSSDVYESIEKNSENLNSAVFGLEPDELKNSIFQMQNIINNIDNYEINFDNNIEYNLNNNKIKNIKNKNIIINNYYYNNNSILTKNIPIESLLIQPQNNHIKTKNFSIIKKNLLANLKKNKKQINSLNSFTNKIGISHLLNKDVKNVLSDTFKMINSTKNKNKSVINNTTTNTNNASNSLGIKNLKNDNIYKNHTQLYSNNIPHTTRLNNYKNLKLNSIIKKLANSDINNSSTLKNGSIIRKDKIKIDPYLINQIINNQTNNLISDRFDSNIDKQKYIEKNKVKKPNNQTSRDNDKNKNKLKIYLDIIKKKGIKDSIYNKQAETKKKILTKKFYYDLKTDRGIYNLNNINQINSKKSSIKSNKKKISDNNNNKKNYISTNILINDNRIKNKHKKMTSEKNSKIITKYASININKNSNNKTNKNSKMKIKGIQIKNFNKIFNLNKEKSNDNFIKTSERSKKSNFNIINTKKMLFLKNTTQNKTKNLNSVNNLISYTEREKAKRIFFSNKI